MGNKDKSNIVSLIREYQNDHKPIIKFYDTRKLPFEDMKVDKFTSHTRGFIKIQDGCNNYCSYCIIPYVRGNIRSKDINVALKEAQDLWYETQDWGEETNLNNADDEEMEDFIFEHAREKIHDLTPNDVRIFLYT